MSTGDSTFGAPDGSPSKTVGEAFADYLRLVEETIRTQVTDDDMKARVRHAMDQAAAGHDPGPEPQIQRDVLARDGGIPEARLRQGGGRALDHHVKGSSGLRHQRALLALMHGSRQGPAVLAGPGGTGKTTAAAALAEHAGALGNQVWWISAADPVTLSQGLTAVTRQLGGARDVEAVARGEADAADRFWRLLDSASPRWLLVFDEADDPRVLAAGNSPAGVQGLTGWVRSSAAGLVLVTSRETDPRMWGAAQLLTIGQLPESDAAQMLLDLAPSAGDADQARALARRLGRHPLSLRLAGRYLRSRAAQGATFAAYERALGQQKKPHAGEHHAAGAAERLTVGAVNLSLDALAREGIPQTRPVLQLASCYASAPIPASLLNPSSLTGLLTGPGGSPPAARSRAAEALRELEDIGILEPTEGGIALHTAITEVGRASLDSPDPSSARIRHAAIKLLADHVAILPPDQPQAWPQYLLLGPHLLSLLQTTADRVDREHLSLLIETTVRTIDAFNQMKASQVACVLGERALTCRAALGNEHRTVLRLRHAVAWAIADCGDLDGAEAVYRDVLQIRLRVLGASDPDVLDSRHELAWIAACRQDWATAETGYRETLDDSIRIRNPDDPRTMLTRHELAWVIANQGPGRLGEAREIFGIILADRRRVLGAEHPRTLTTLHELVWITAMQGRWEEAETGYRELLALRLRILGEDHADTILTRHELAWVTARRGRIPEAESSYSDVLSHSRQILGKDHRQTLATQKALEELRHGRIVDAYHPA
jgi:hypothetical protein